MPEEWIRTLLLCGAAGGISATFNAPIGGVLFALEVLQRRFVPGNFASLVIASVTADVVAQNFLGEEPSFLIPTPAYTMASNWEILPYILLGIVAALAAFAFVRLFYKTENLFGDLRFPGYLKPALGGIIIGLIGMHYFDILGVGYGAGYGLGGVETDVGGVDRALFGDLAVGTLLILLVMKMLATSATLGTGGSGGVFAPSLFIGAMLGGAFGIAVHGLFPGITAASAAEASGAYALVGMGAFFAATAHAPMTAIVMLFEMTRDYALILPLMLTVVISALVSRNLNRESIYTLKLVRRGVDINRREVADVLGEIKVTDIMTRNFPTVRTSMPVSKVMEKLHRSGHHGFPVLDESGAFYGIVALEDVESAMSRHDLATLTAGDIANRSPIVAHPGQSIHDALTQLGGRDVGRIPVVAREDPKKLLGVLRRHDIVSAYTKTLGNRGVK